MLEKNKTWRLHNFPLSSPYQWDNSFKNSKKLKQKWTEKIVVQ